MSNTNVLELACAHLALFYKNQKILMSELTAQFGKWFNLPLIESLKQHSLVEIDHDRLSLSSQGEALASLSLEKKNFGELLGKSWFHFSGETLQEFSTLIQNKIDEKGLETLKNYFKNPPSAHTLPLSEAIPGQWHPIWIVSTQDFGIMEKVQQFQILPGKMIKVFQKFPVFVIETENSKLVIDSGLAAQILVAA